MTNLEYENDIKDANECIDIVFELEVNLGKLKAILEACQDHLFLDYTHLEPAQVATIMANHEDNGFLFAAGKDYLRIIEDKLDYLKDELNAIKEGINERKLINKTEAKIN